jgi:hypothetical protein
MLEPVVSAGAILLIVFVVMMLSGEVEEKSLSAALMYSAAALERSTSLSESFIGPGIRPYLSCDPGSYFAPHISDIMV